MILPPRLLPSSNSGTVQLYNDSDGRDRVEHLWYLSGEEGRDRVDVLDQVLEVLVRLEAVHAFGFRGC